MQTIYSRMNVSLFDLNIINIINHFCDQNRKKNL